MAAHGAKVQGATCGAGAVEAPSSRSVTSALPWTPRHSRTQPSQLSRRPRRPTRSSDVRVEYLGRKSELKLALREVRDRETGMALNALRERLEAAIDAREAELSRAELDRRLTRGARRRHDARHADPARASPPDHADPPRGRGHLPRPRILGRGRPRGRDDALQLRRAQLPARPSDAVAAPDAVPRRRDGAPDGDLALADPDDGGAGAPASTSSRSAASTAATPRMRRTRRRSIRSRGSRSTKASRWATSRARSTTS